MTGTNVKLTAAVVVKKSLFRSLNSDVTHMYSGTKAETVRRINLQTTERPI